MVAIPQTVRYILGIDTSDTTARRNYGKITKGYSAEGGVYIIDRLLASAEVFSVPLHKKSLLIATSAKLVSVTIVKPTATMSFLIDGMFFLSDATDITSVTIANGAALTVTTPEAVRIISV